MKLARLFQTTHFRLALLGMAVFGAMSALLLFVVYAGAMGLIDHETNSAIEAEARGVTDEYRLRKLRGLRKLVSERAQDPLLRDHLYLLVDAKGQILAGNLAEWPASATPVEGWVQFPLAPDPATRVIHPARAKVLPIGPGGHQLLVGRNISERNGFKQLVTRSVLLGLALTLLLSFVGGVILSRRLLLRVDAVARATQHVTAGDLRQRIPVGSGHDEFDRLCRNVNEMLDQIEKLTLGMRAAVDSISHDLRAPLTRMRGRIEMALMERDPVTYRAALKDALGESDRLLATFNILLQIAQAEAGVASRVPVDLGALAADVAELYEPLAEERGAEIQVAAAPAAMLGNRELLAQALANLLDNAIKYSPDQATIRVEVSSAQGQVQLAVSDHGPGVPEAERDRVLDRFVRLDSSRSTPGSGLGLSLVAAVARLHQGRVSLADNNPGLKVVLTLPAA